MSKCTVFEQLGICVNGTSCQFTHDYSQSHNMSIALNAIMAQIRKLSVHLDVLSEDILELKATVETNLKVKDPMNTILSKVGSIETKLKEMAKSMKTGGIPLQSSLLTFTESAIDDLPVDQLNSESLNLRSMRYSRQGMGKKNPLTKKDSYNKVEKLTSLENSSGDDKEEGDNDQESSKSFVLSKIQPSKKQKNLKTNDSNSQNSEIISEKLVPTRLLRSTTVSQHKPARSKSETSLQIDFQEDNDILTPISVERKRANSSSSISSSDSKKSVLEAAVESLKSFAFCRRNSHDNIENPIISEISHQDSAVNPDPAKDQEETITEKVDDK